MLSKAKAGGGSGGGGRRRGKGKGKGKGKHKHRPGSVTDRAVPTVDPSYLAFEYHQAIVSGLTFLVPQIKAARSATPPKLVQVRVTV